jgi:DNA-directed RNA polymerase specialized sigma subunit|nr:MAG TPA: response regulator protein [Caudoviricetes sp.]
MKRKINIDDLLNEYEIDYSMFTNMDDRLLSIYPKWLELNKADKTVIILYAEYHSYREVGRILGISHTTIQRFIKQIRERLC